MAHRFDQIVALVQNAKGRFSQLQDDYKKSLHEKQVSVELQIVIKGIIDNLRSALDYLACEIYANSITQGQKDQIYFPIARKGANRNDFPSLAEKNIHGIIKNSPDLLKLLEGFQEFSSSDNSWLPELATLSNENKHKNLSHQERSERQELRIHSGGNTISLGQGTQISLGSGCSITIGGMVIPGGQTIGPGNPPQVLGNGKIENITWISFEFADINQPVLPFLQRATDGVLKIAEKIRTHIEGTKHK